MRLPTSQEASAAQIRKEVRDPRGIGAIAKISILTFFHATDVELSIA
jgi:hypothetical protein